MATGGDELALKDLRGSNVVLYFYPKDNTSGCTKQGCEFTRRNEWRKVKVKGHVEEVLDVVKDL